MEVKGLIVVEKDRIGKLADISFFHMAIEKGLDIDKAQTKLATTICFAKILLTNNAFLFNQLPSDLLKTFSRWKRLERYV